MGTSIPYHDWTDLAPGQTDLNAFDFAETFDHKVQKYEVKMLDLVDSHLSYFKSARLLYMFSPIKGFYLIVPFRAARDQQQFWFWLRGVELTLRCDTRHGGILCGVMHTAEFFFNNSKIVGQIETKYENI